MAEAEDSVRALHGISPEGPFHRIARLPNPWAWPDWANVGTDGTFGSRWDDVQGVYRVLYASSSRFGAFIEVLARFRPDPHIVAEMKQMKGAEGPRVSAAPGELDIAWLRSRCIGTARLRAEFADVGHSTSLARLRRDLAARIVHHGLGDLDAAAIRISAPRRFTQEISRWVYDQSTRQGERRFAGIAYRSRLGDDFQNWALFESPGDGEPWSHAPVIAGIDAGDPDLLRALEVLEIRLAGG